MLHGAVTRAFQDLAATEDSQGLDLRMMERLRRVVYGRAGSVRSRHSTHSSFPGRKPSPIVARTLRFATRAGFWQLVACPLAATNELCERCEQAIAGEAEHDRPISRQEYAVGNDFWNHFGTTRRASAGDILRERAVPEQRRSAAKSRRCCPCRFFHAINAARMAIAAHPRALVDKRVGDGSGCPSGSPLPNIWLDSAWAEPSLRSTSAKAFDPVGADRAVDRVQRDAGPDSPTIRGFGTHVCEEYVTASATSLTSSSRSRVLEL